MTTRKPWSGEEKLRIAFEGLRPNAYVESVCRAHGIHSVPFYEWKEPALASMDAGLENRPGTDDQPPR